MQWLFHHSLPLASDLRRGLASLNHLQFCVLFITSLLKHEINPGSLIFNYPLDHSLPLATVLTGCDCRTFLDQDLS